MKTTPDISIVVPCYNESGNLPELVERIHELLQFRSLDGEIILVNDASTDHSKDVMDKLMNQYPRLRAVHHQTNRGIAESWNSGIEQAGGKYICLIDADLQYQPEDIWRLYSEIQFSRCDMVQGHRSHIERAPDPRYYYSRVLSLALNLLFGMSLRDNKSGFVIARQDVLRDIIRYRTKFNYFQTFISVTAKCKGYTIREVEVLFRDRLVGKSFIRSFPLRIVLETCYDLVKALVEFRLREPRNLVLEDFLETQDIKDRDPLTGWRKLWFDFFTFTMPLHHWNISRRAVSDYQMLRKTQWLPADQITKLQEIKLRQLIHHAYHHVHYYREIFDQAGLRPEDIQTVDDLGKLPLLDKDKVRKHLHFSLMSDNHRKDRIVAIQTSGSTGEPFTCYVDKSQLEMRWAATQRGMDWTGYRFGDKQARLWHQNIGMTRMQVAREKLCAFLCRRMFIPAFEMSDKTLPRTIRKLEKYQPVLMDGYAESFNFLAHYIRSKSLPAFKPKSIVSSAQILPEKSRKTLESTFDCQVFDKYGSREFSGIAYEGPAHDGKHIVAENYIVEILVEGRKALPGEIGEVVITDLNNYCMPFIRYRIGDLARAVDPGQRSACGRELPRIGEIEGRVQSIIFGADGIYVPSSLFGHFFKDYEHIIRFYQVVQEKEGAVTLKVVKALRFEDAQFRSMLEKLQLILGKGTDIQVEFVDEIPMVRTGKRQVCVSKLDFDYQELKPSESTTAAPD